MHEAALAAGKLTRDGTGGQLTFPEVIMSRRQSCGGCNNYHIWYTSTLEIITRPAALY